MNEFRQIAKDFITSYFNIKEDFFETAWDFINSHYDELSSFSKPAEGITQLGGPLSLIGEEQQEAVKVILVFADSFKQLPVTSKTEDLISTIQIACHHYQAHAKIQEDIRKHITSMNEKIEKILKDRQKGLVEETKPESVKEKCEGEKPEYEMLQNRRKKEIILSVRAEKIRSQKGSLTGKCLFIDDERKEVFFNRKLINEFQGQMYSMLRYFLENEGVGGDKENVYKKIWEDYTESAREENVSGAVDTAMKRFRDILKENKICSVEIRSEGVFASKKIYVLKPTPNYCILKKIELD